jgi:glycosyltransferase involved in cell wall biosynthesis
VLFTGSRVDVDQLLGAMDLFVCSSRWEGFSTVLMEAMAAGVPIVATDIPGNRELLQPGKSAWFVSSENPADLAEGLVKAYQHPELSKELARNAQQDVKSFGIEEIAKTHTGLYQFFASKAFRSSWLNHRASDAQLGKITSKT